MQDLQSNKSGVYYPKNILGVLFWWCGDCLRACAALLLPVSSRPNGRYLPCVCRSHIQRSPCCCTNFHQQKPSWLQSLQRNSFLFPQHLYSPAGTIVHSIEIVENKLSTMKTTNTRRAALSVVAAVAVVAFSADCVSASNGRVVVGASSRRMLRHATSNKRQLSWSWTSLLRKWLLLFCSRKIIVCATPTLEMFHCIWFDPFSFSLVIYFAPAFPSLKLVLQSISAHPLILILLLAVPALLAAVPTAALVTPRQMMFRLTPARAPVMAATIMPAVPGAPSSAGWE